MTIRELECYDEAIVPLHGHVNGQLKFGFGIAPVKSPVEMNPGAVRNAAAPEFMYIECRSLKMNDTQK